MEKELDIPRKSKPASLSEPQPETNGVPPETNGTSKRKRDADEAELGNGEQQAKRLAATSDDADSSKPIVLDEGPDGAILIDDD